MTTGISPHIGKEHLVDVWQRIATLRSERDIVGCWPANVPPLVTIHCVTYNHRCFIEEALSGFLSQITAFPFHVIIHDDASTDGTTEVVRAFESRYPAIIAAVYQQDNQRTLGRNPSTFLEPLWQGKYIAFCEGDDYWTDCYKLQKQVDAIESYGQQYVLAYHDYQTVDENKVVIQASQLRNRGRHLSGEDLISGDMGGIRIHNSTLLVRRAAMVPPPRESLGMVNGDRVRLALLGLQGGAIFVDDILPSVYRKHRGGVYSGVDRDMRIADGMATRLALHRYFRRTANDHAARLLWKDFIRFTAHRFSLRDVVYLIRQIGKRYMSALRRFLGGAKLRRHKNP